jgi:hypothetical protein
VRFSDPDDAAIGSQLHDITQKIWHTAAGRDNGRIGLRDRRHLETGDHQRGTLRRQSARTTYLDRLYGRGEHHP